MENQQRYIPIDGQQIPVTENVYRANRRPAWAEHKRKEREKRCVISNGRAAQNAALMTEANAISNGGVSMIP